LVRGIEGDRRTVVVTEADKTGNGTYLHVRGKAPVVWIAECLHEIVMHVVGVQEVARDEIEREDHRKRDGSVGDQVLTLNIDAVVEHDRRQKECRRLRGAGLPNDLARVEIELIQVRIRPIPGHE
jgi:hypothetical protein